MRCELFTVTRKFGKIRDFSERVCRSIFSAIFTAFEAYGTALCGHVPSTCPTEDIPLRSETKQVLREPRTKTFVVARSRSNPKLPAVSQWQL